MLKSLFELQRLPLKNGFLVTSQATIHFERICFLWVNFSDIIAYYLLNFEDKAEENIAFLAKYFFIYLLCEI